MFLFLSVLACGVVAAALLALVASVRRLAAAVEARQADDGRARVLQVLAVFAQGAVAAHDDPKSILAWHPLASAARALFPDEFATLDRAAGGAFPFGPERVQEAHATWTADWLVWEQAHDTHFKLRIAEAQAELAATGSTVARAKLDAVEREKLDLYQARYGQYVRVSKALQAVMAVR